MKWAAYLLCTLNILAFLFGWSQLRELQLNERYEVDDRITELSLLKANPLNDGEALCTLLGPFEGGVATEMKSSLRKIGVEGLVIAQDLDLAPKYWVYYDVKEAGEESAQALKRFKEDGIDGYIISKGALKGNVSLGVFKNIDSARRMKKILSKSGYESKLDEIKQTEQSYWVLLDQIYLSENKGKITGLLESKNASKEMRQIFCKSVASEN